MAPLRAVALTTALFAIAPAHALLDAGPEFQVNTYTTGPQRTPAVAVQSNGSFVVTWASGSEYYHDAPDDSAAGVFLQRFDQVAARVGDEQHVNTFTIDAQLRPDVGARGDGSFVVVWESGCYYGTAGCSPDGSRRAVALQRFDAAGAPGGGEQAVNTFTLGNQIRPAVAVAPGGEFVVVWGNVSYAYPVPGHDTDGAFAQRFDATGAPAGGELAVNEGTIGLQDDPDVAIDAAGNFVVVWRDYSYVDPSYVVRVLGRRFDAGGTPLGDTIEVADGRTAQAFYPAVAAAEDGEFVVVWQAYHYAHVERSEVVGRRFAADGTPLGGAFAVNTYTTGEQYLPAVATDAAGNFVVTWASNAYSGEGQDGDRSGVFAQAFAHDGAPLGSEQQVNVFTTGFQNDPDVAANAMGEFVVAWTSSPYYGTGAQDGDQSGVFARRLVLRSCSGSAECDDANPCTVDACQGGVCLNRRQAGCCQLPIECSDGDPCTDDVCTGTACSNPPVAACTPCGRTLPCGLPNLCTTAVCLVDLGRCEYAPIPGCCLTAADCDDGFTCTENVCGPGNTCTTTPIPECVGCEDDADCTTGCLVGPETCAAGRCESPAGCPVVTIDETDPLGEGGKLLARIVLPADVPGKGKIKAVVTATVDMLDEGEQPKRRCKSGKRLGRTRAVLAPESDTNLLLALTKAGARCLAADADGALPSDVTVRLKRKKQPLSEVTEPRTWRR